MRNLTPAQLTHYQGEHFRETVFAEMHFASGVMRVHDSTGAITWGGHDWLGLGDLGAISEIEESSDLGVRTFTLTLSGVDPGLLASALDRTDYKGREVALWLGQLDAAGDLIDTPRVLARGMMDVAGIIRQDGLGQISMRCERESVRLARPLTTRMSDQDHQLRHPGDKINSHMAALINKDVQWGMSRISPPSRGPAFNGGSNERAPFRQR